MLTFNFILRSLLPVAVVIVQIAQPAFGATTYTPEQLRKMVSAGKPPKQGPATSRSESLPFDQCKSFVKTMLNNAAAENYPTRSGEGGGAAYAQKIWANDGAIVMTCEASKSLLVITTSPYQ
ncbi:MAG TPA: hypothetical protein PLW24_15190 [Burkholderiaceae bacterium]|nr:hypothetical protein [Burkholderiaceae bacterium]